MKKWTAIVLALAMTLALGASALAVPTAEINPQQKGHVAYLESIHGKAGAKKVLQSYHETTVLVAKDTPAAQQPLNNITEGTGIVISQPSSTAPVWSSLQVGDYFTHNGSLYYVGRFTTLSNARVLVAYPAASTGYYDPTSPRYFYI